MLAKLHAVLVAGRNLTSPVPTFVSQRDAVLLVHNAHGLHVVMLLYSNIWTVVVLLYSNIWAVVVLLYSYIWAVVMLLYSLYTWSVVRLLYSYIWTVVMLLYSVQLHTGCCHAAVQ